MVDQSTLPLSTLGGKIINTRSDPVKLSCVNWYGAHMGRYVVDGLDEVDINSIAQDIANDGFNCVRLVFSLEQYYNDPVVTDDVVAANPQLKGKTSMEVFDATV